MNFSRVAWHQWFLMDRKYKEIAELELEKRMVSTLLKEIDQIIVYSESEDTRISDQKPLE